MQRRVAEAFEGAALGSTVRLFWTKSAPVLSHQEVDVYDCDMAAEAFESLFSRVQSFTDQAGRALTLKQYCHGRLVYECDHLREREKAYARSLLHSSRAAPHWLALTFEESGIPVERFPCTRALNDVTVIERRSFALTPCLRLVFETHAWPDRRARHVYFSFVKGREDASDAAARLVDKYASLLRT
jgi:hypothetical protein